MISLSPTQVLILLSSWFSFFFFFSIDCHIQTYLHVLKKLFLTVAAAVDVGRFALPLIKDLFSSMGSSSDRISADLKHVHVWSQGGLCSNDPTNLSAIVLPLLQLRLLQVPK